MSHSNDFRWNVNHPKMNFYCQNYSMNDYMNPMNFDYKNLGYENLMNFGCMNLNFESSSYCLMSGYKNWNYVYLMNFDCKNLDDCKNLNDYKMNFQSLNVYSSKVMNKNVFLMYYLLHKYYFV